MLRANPAPNCWQGFMFQQVLSILFAGAQQKRSSQAGFLEHKQKLNDTIVKLNYSKESSA